MDKGIGHIFDQYLYEKLQQIIWDISKVAESIWMESLTKYLA